MSERRFEGKVALVTGGNSGIGLAVARGARRPKGRESCSSGANRSDGRRAAAQIWAARPRVSSPTPVGSTASTASSRRRASSAAAGSTSCSATPAIGAFGLIATISEQKWDEIMDVNVKGLYFTVQKALPLMTRGGAIVLNASVAARKGDAGGSIYGASKAAVRSLGRSLGAELVGAGIRVNVVSPGPIETPIFVPRRNEREADRRAQGRVVRPQSDEALRLADEVAASGAVPRLRCGVVHHRRRPARRRRRGSF